MNNTTPSSVPPACGLTCLPIGVFSAALGFSTWASAPQFNVAPASPVLTGEPLQIVLSGLPKAAEITVTARRSVTEYTGGQHNHTAQAR